MIPEYEEPREEEPRNTARIERAARRDRNEESETMSTRAMARAREEEEHG